MSERKVLGRALKMARKFQGIKQEDLALAGGISASHLQRIETGDRQPTDDCLSLMCIHLGISTEDVSYEVETLILVADASYAKHIHSSRKVLVAA